ncbi:MAG: monovalent cation/H+ antiporter subunit D family protein [Acidobacteriota bacterium]
MSDPQQAATAASFLDHLPALQVLVPLMSAPLCLLARNAFAARLISRIAGLTTLGIAISLLQRVRAEGVISYALGGWAPPLGIEYRIDALNVYLLLVVASIAAVVLLFGPGRAGARIPESRRNLFYAATLLTIAGLLGMAITGDIFNVFVFLEISSLSSYSLVALGSNRRALMAAFSYLIVGAIGATFLLIGIGLMYQMTGTLNLVDLAERLPAVLGTRTLLVAFSFLVVGLSIKLAVFPLHQWLPNAYTYAPAAVSALLAATGTKVSYYLLARVLFGLFGVAFVFDQHHLHYLLVPLSLAAMFSGSIAAIYQSDVKRLLAFSSVAQVGYMTLGLSFASLTGLMAGLLHVGNHALMKGGLFLAVACVTYRLNSSEIRDYRGLGRRMPWTMAAFLVGGLAMIGVPGTVGFISKWYLIQAALERGWLPVVFLIVASSMLALVYIGKVAELAYFHAPPARADGAPPAREEAPWTLLAPTWLLISATVVFGIWAEPTVALARAAAATLLAPEVGVIAP